MFKFQIGKPQRTITQMVLFSLITHILISILSGPLNSILKRYGDIVNKTTCDIVWSLKNENLQRLFYQLCIATKDHKLSNDEIYSLIDNIQKIYKSPYNDFFVDDKTIRDMRIEYSTGYAIDSYINKIQVKPFVRFDKPKGYFQDVYAPNKYNEEQKVLLEQAQYTEFPSNHSKAQEILGPARELKYVGLHFPYGLNLEKSTDQ